jgi:hypothetical protein
MTNRQRYPMVDNVASLSLILGWMSAAVGKTYHVTMSLQGQVLDGRDPMELLATIDDYKLFAPQGTRLELLGVDKAPTGGTRAQAAYPINPTEDVRYTLQFLLHVPAGAGAQNNLLLALFGHLRATGAPTPSGWPAVTETAGAPITLATAGGTPIPCNVAEVAMGGGISDIGTVLSRVVVAHGDVVTAHGEVVFVR